ncbi:hypothetical protein O4H61_20865, partial [Roseovarius aestuarii]|nr:hypothetical protein [Roseovarius aestuarii]
NLPEKVVKDEKQKSKGQLVNMEKDILEKISLLVDKAYEQIDKSLDYSSFGQIENGVSKGFDDVLEIQRIINQFRKG